MTRTRNIRLLLAAVAVSAVLLLSARQSMAGSFSISLGVGGGSGRYVQASYGARSYQGGVHMTRWRHRGPLTRPLRHGRPRIVRIGRHGGYRIIVIAPSIYRPHQQRATFWHGRRR